MIGGMGCSLQFESFKKKENNLGVKKRPNGSNFQLLSCSSNNLSALSTSLQ